MCSVRTFIRAAPHCWLPWQCNRNRPLSFPVSSGGNVCDAEHVTCSDGQHERVLTNVTHDLFGVVQNWQVSLRWEAPLRVAVGLCVLCAYRGLNCPGRKEMLGRLGSGRC